MERIKYTNSGESYKRGEEPAHFFDLFNEKGEKIGEAEVRYLSKPMPHYQLSDLFVNPQYQGKGFGSKILDQVEDFLKKRKKPGVLVDGINDERFMGMYQRRGWVQLVNDETLLGFNLPENLDKRLFEAYGQRYTFFDERKSSKS